MNARGSADRFRFSTTWSVPAPPGAVFEAVATPEDYPRWWREVREVTRTGPDGGHCRFRSALPVDLRVTVRAVRRDPAAGVLEIALTGQLDGRMTWTVTAADGPGGGSLVRVEQDTALLHPLLRRLPRAARPLLRANHAWMMRSGERGLRAWLRKHLDDG
ncbi:SRPBCC family protein [Streptomyces avicenniae]|uniref:SRPBCC family protein n=1 Tax=Streptomyces avicenniae TaxID=500153 RepID=UPI000A7FFDFB|nr:SRPBCC family protein [Streptomyces avicenniae]